MMTLLLAGLLALNAEAGVYKCRDANGVLSYQDAPCPGQGKLTTIDDQPGRASSGSGLAPGTYDMSREHQARVAASQRDRQASGLALKRELARQRAVQNAIRGQRIIEGMSYGEARQSWGPPSDIRKGRAGDHWVYRRRGKAYASIRFDRNGSVISAHRSSR